MAGREVRAVLSAGETGVPSEGATTAASRPAGSERERSGRELGWTGR